MAVHRNKTIAYVSYLIWTMSFEIKAENDKYIPKVNYEKYKSGEDDYIYETPNTVFTGFN